MIFTRTDVKTANGALARSASAGVFIETECFIFGVFLHAIFKNVEQNDLSKV